MFTPRRGTIPTFVAKLTFTQSLHLLMLSAPLIYLKTTTKTNENCHDLLNTSETHYFLSHNAMHGLFSVLT